MAQNLKVRRNKRKANGSRSHNKRGFREGKLTNAVKRSIFDAVRIGMKEYRAAEMAGITKTTFNHWLDRGRKEKRGKYHNFRKNLKMITKSREYEALEVIRKCGTGMYTVIEKKIKTTGSGQLKQQEIEIKEKVILPQWQAHAWYLERLHKDIYGREATFDEATPEERARTINQLVSAMDLSVPAPSGGSNGDS
jgi:hypothetical protein